MNPLIDEISKNLPQPSDFGVGNSEYIGWENEIERLKKIPEEYKRNYSYFFNAVAVVAGIVGFIFSLYTIGAISILLFLYIVFPGMTILLDWDGKKYTDEYERVINKIVELKSKKYSVDSKYSSAKNVYLDKELSQYKDTYLYRKRSSSYGFAENLQTYSDAIEYFSEGYRHFLTEHRDYVKSRDVLVTPHKRLPQQSISRPKVTEDRAPVQTNQAIQEVKDDLVATEELELRLENTASLPPQQVERQFNNSNDQSASRASSREKANMLIGNTGEEAVANYERSMLQENGREYLVDRVEVVSKTIGDGLGYDVLSFDKHGNEKFIEVKTTRNNSSTANFAFTRGELNFLAKNPDTAFVYCVFGINTSSPRLKIYPASKFLDKSFETIEYRASLR